MFFAKAAVVALGDFEGAHNSSSKEESERMFEKKM